MNPIEATPYVLVVDDEKDLRILLQKELKLEGYKVKVLDNAIDIQGCLQKENVDIVLLDIVLPGIDGIQALQIIKEYFPEIEVIVLTGNATIDNAIQTMKLGAYDYVTKPYRFNELLTTIQRAYEHKRTKYLSDLLRREIDFKENQGWQMIGQSQALQKVFTQIMQVAPTESSVLIDGESGTGKELVARAIHANSSRQKKSFLSINCGALSASTLHSELFGYEKGAFTGANQRKLGLFEVASGGTIFLDEIGDMLLENQVYLLQVIETKLCRRLGGVKDIAVDARIVAATNKNLLNEVQSKRFREDLFYRLNVFRIFLPPLRERKEDIPLLLNYFLQAIKIPGKSICGIHPLALEFLQEYDWPGNVRELKNVVERALITSNKELLMVQDFPLLEKVQTGGEPGRQGNSGAVDERLAADWSLEGMEKRHIAQALSHFDGSRSKTAKALGISPRSLYDKIIRYRLSEPASE